MFTQFQPALIGAAITAGLLLASPVDAQPSTSPQRQAEVVVTATRTPIAQDEALVSVSVIDRDTIERHGSLDVVALLRAEAGVDIVRGGGVGQQTSVFLRGGNSNHVLVLIDGLRVATATTGGYEWEHLPLELIERIEIVRGPRAALFGSDAIGGVIQIFTRRASGPTAMLGVASHDTWMAEAGYGRRSERGGFGLRATAADSGGFSAQNSDGFAFDPDDDGYRNRSLSADAALVGDHLRLDAQLLDSDADVEFDQGTSDFATTTLNLKLAGGGESPWQVAIGGLRSTLETPDFFSRFETRRRQLEAQRSQRIGERGEWLVGASLVRDEGRSIDTFSGDPQYDENRRQRALFTSWRDGRGALDWELGARNDHYDSFGGETSLQGASGWRIDGGPRLRAGYSEGFRAPTLNELYSPGFGGLFAGNPGLDPERSRSLELGADWRGERIDVSLSAYRNRVDELIDFSGGETFRAINIRRADLRGVELEARTELAGWSLAGNLGWQRARDADFDTALLRRPARKANLQMSRPLGATRLGLAMHAVSGRPEFGGELPGFATIDAWLHWPIATTLDFDLRFENIFDRDATLASGFNTPGATASLQLRWSPR